MELEYWQPSENQKLQQIKKHPGAELPHGSALFIESLSDFSAKQFPC